MQPDSPKGKGYTAKSHWTGHGTPIMSANRTPQIRGRCRRVKEAQTCAINSRAISTAAAIICPRLSTTL